MDVLGAVVELTGAESVDLVGSSMGGATALNYAAANPDQIERLVLVNSGGLEGHDAADSGGVPDGAWWVLRYLPDMALDYFVNWTAGGNDTGNEFRDHFRQTFRAPDVRRGIIGRMQDFKSPTTAEALGQITVPTLIQWGGDNPQLPPAQALAFSDLLTQAPCKQTEVYANAAHMLPIEGHKAPLDDLIAFLNGGCTA